MSEVGALYDHLVRYPTATVGLAMWCDEFALGSGPIAAQIVSRGKQKGRSRELAWRHVRLHRGPIVLSEALIVFSVSLLSSKMRYELENTNRPFGEIIAQLSPYRRTTFFQTAPDWRAGEAANGAGTILELHATIFASSRLPIARVHERYQSSLLRSAHKPGEGSAQQRVLVSSAAAACSAERDRDKRDLSNDVLR